MTQTWNSFPSPLPIDRMDTGDAAAYRMLRRVRQKCRLCGIRGGMMVFLPLGMVACSGVSYIICARRQGMMGPVPIAAEWLPGHLRLN